MYVFYVLFVGIFFLRIFVLFLFLLSFRERVWLKNYANLMYVLFLLINIDLCMYICICIFIQYMYLCMYACINMVL